MMAAARLMMSQPQVSDVKIMFDHWDKYELWAWVWNDEFHSCPLFQGDYSFEGFVVRWRKHTYEFDPKHAAKLVGVWRTESSDCDAEFSIAVNDNQLEVRGRRISDNETLNIRVIDFDGWQLMFEVIGSGLSGFGAHRFTPVDGNRCEGAFVIPIEWHRVETNDT